MDRIQVCGECGIPLMISGELLWEGNRVIYSRSSPRNRWVFYESDNIDPLFGGIENLIGAPLNHIIIESRCREARKYIERAFPLEVRRLLYGGITISSRGSRLRTMPGLRPAA